MLLNDPKIRLYRVEPAYMQPRWSYNKSVWSDSDVMLGNETRPERKVREERYSHFFHHLTTIFRGKLGIV